MVAIDRGPGASYADSVARRRGPLLLVAFLAAVIAGGGGGVRAPWLPRQAQDEPTPGSVVRVVYASGLATWRLPRME